MDYREISQQYAQGAIKAAFLLNGGASVAMLTQLNSLDYLAKALVWAMVAWAAGLVSSALAWAFGFAATRAFDDWQRFLASDVSRADTYRVTGNNWQTAALVVLCLALVFFLAGSGFLALGYSAYHADVALGIS